MLACTRTARFSRCLLGACVKDVWLAAAGWQNFGGYVTDRYVQYKQFTYMQSFCRCDRRPDHHQTCVLTWLATWQVALLRSCRQSQGCLRSEATQCKINHSLRYLRSLHCVQGLHIRAFSRNFGMAFSKVAAAAFLLMAIMAAAIIPASALICLPLFYEV